MTDKFWIVKMENAMSEMKNACTRIICEECPFLTYCSALEKADLPTPNSLYFTTKTKQE